MQNLETFRYCVVILGDFKFKPKENAHGISNKKSEIDLITHDCKIQAKIIIIGNVYTNVSDIILEAIGCTELILDISIKLYFMY